MKIDRPNSSNPGMPKALSLKFCSVVKSKKNKSDLHCQSRFTANNSSVRKQAGFTLLEVMIALGIFAVLAIAMSDVTTQSSFNLDNLEKKTIASWIAKNRLTEVRLGPYKNTSSSAKDKIDYANQEWEINTSVRPFEMQAAIPITPKLMIIEVSVSHGENPDRSLYSLTGYVAEHEFR